MIQQVFKPSFQQFGRFFGRLAPRLAVVLVVGGVSAPAHANPLTDFASQMADQAWSHIETALGHPPGPTFATSNATDDQDPSANRSAYGSAQPGLNPTSSQPRNTRPATSLMVSQAGMAALENMRVGASIDLGAGHQEQAAPSPMTPVMAGLSDNQVRDEIVREHLASYTAGGRCMCPDQSDKKGQPCGRRAGYGKSNTNVAVCFSSQIDQRMVWEWRSAHPSAH